jgi:hypothetical protein
VSDKNRVETVEDALFRANHGAGPIPAEVATYLEAHGWTYEYSPTTEEVEAQADEMTGTVDWRTP